MRKLLILSIACLMTLCAMAQIDAIKVTQGETTDWYPFGKSSRIDVAITNGNIVFPNKTYDLTNGNVETEFGTAPADEWFTLRTDVTANDWNTICLERNITAIDGATFWTVSGQNATSFILDEITEPQAGKGYIIRFTKSELKVKYGDQVAYTPAIADETNPIQGTFEQIDAAETNELVGNYIVYENQLRKVVSWVGLYAHRAYVVAELVPKGEPQLAPKAARMYMPKPNSTPTDNSSLHHSINSSFKMIKDGHFMIIRDNKMYNAQGQMIQ